MRNLRPGRIQYPGAPDRRIPCGKLAAKFHGPVNKGVMKGDNFDMDSNAMNRPAHYTHSVMLSRGPVHPVGYPTSVRPGVPCRGRGHHLPDTIRADSQGFRRWADISWPFAGNTADRKLRGYRYMVKSTKNETRFWFHGLCNTIITAAEHFMNHIFGRRDK